MPEPAAAPATIALLLRNTSAAGLDQRVKAHYRPYHDIHFIIDDSTPMSRVQSFPPLETAAAHTLILGSMPGVASLRAQQYYAYPHNLFWPLIEAALGIGAALPYEERVQALMRQGFALWDVLASCHRPGSLDAQIDAGTVELNDFPQFFATHPQVERVFFNGATAEHYFRRHVLPRLPQPVAARLRLARLPSTSPANASIRLADKTAAWEQIRR